MSEERTNRSIEERVARIEAKSGESDFRRELQNVEVFVRKLRKREGTKAASVSTYSSACTSACFSSASTLCASGALTAAASDPELAQVFATLHRRGVEVLGEEGLMEEMLKQAKANKPVSIFSLAERE